MNSKLFFQIIHWMSLLSGAVVSGAAAFYGDPHMAPYALTAISVAQIVHKFADIADHQDTLSKAISEAAKQIKP